jgi:hypothetical protein
MKSSREPYVSVVVTTRNDDHGGDPLKRLQAFINTFAEQCRRTGLDAEIVVVEWNPPDDRPRVAELCRVPAHAPFDVRFVEVPAALHQALRFASVLPLFQMIAKNVGIRRARGRYILVTNIDIIFSNELVEELAARRLAPGVMYRVDRHDIDPDFPVEGSLAEQMAFCGSHHLRLHTSFGTYPVDPAGRVTTLAPDIVGAGVSLDSGWHPREGDPTNCFRWATAEARITLGPSQTRYEKAALNIELEPNPYQRGSWCELEIRDEARQLAVIRIDRRGLVRIPLDDCGPARRIEMRMLASSGGRESLPLFESRDSLCYRVFNLSVGPASTYECDLRLWERASNNNPQLSVSRSASGVEITSDPGSYSYCARYGPLEAQSAGTYEFAIDCDVVSGAFDFTAMDDQSQSWLPTRRFTILDEGRMLAGISVSLSGPTRFSIVATNNRPGGGVSRCVLRRVTASVPFDRLRAETAPTPAPRWFAVLYDLPFRPFRWLRARMTAFEKRRAARFHETITDESTRVHDLETRVASLEELSELAPMARLLRDQRPAPLHQNACGDFQLMAREHWFDLRAYPEFEMFSMGLDGLFESIAHAAGIREQIFAMPLCIYHLEHEKGSGWTPEGEAALRKRIAESGITWLDASTVHIWTTYMGWLGRPMIFNSERWGLGEMALAERTIQPGVQMSGVPIPGDAG